MFTLLKKRGIPGIFTVWLNIFYGFKNSLCVKNVLNFLSLK